MDKNQLKRLQNIKSSSNSIFMKISKPAERNKVDKLVLDFKTDPPFVKSVNVDMS